jgi:hypothetical protein
MSSQSSLFTLLTSEMTTFSHRQPSSMNVGASGSLFPVSFRQQTAWFVRDLGHGEGMSADADRRRSARALLAGSKR